MEQQQYDAGEGFHRPTPASDHYHRHIIQGLGVHMLEMTVQGVWAA